MEKGTVLTADPLQSPGWIWADPLTPLTAGALVASAADTQEAGHAVQAGPAMQAGL